MKILTICLFLPMAFLMTTLLLFEVNAAPPGLMLLNGEITPTIVHIGEIASVSMRIRNNGNISESGKVMIVCGDNCIGTQLVSDLAPRTTEDLSFKFNTSDMSTGIYPIKVMIEKASGQQEIYDLGNITLENNTPAEATLLSQIPGSLVYLLSPIPVLAAGVWILHRRRNRQQESGAPEGKLPHLFNEILKFEERIGTRAQNTIAQDREYVC